MSMSIRDSSKNDEYNVSIFLLNPQVGLLFINRSTTLRLASDEFNRDPVLKHAALHLNLLVE